MKKESAAWRVLRDSIVKTAQELGGSVHIVRIENMVEAGVFDANICFKGHDFWLEGKYIEQLPARQTTLIKVGMSEDQRVFAIRRCMAGGFGYLWAKVGIDRRAGDGVWYLFPLHSVAFIDQIWRGIKLAEFLDYRYGTAKELALELLRGSIFNTKEELYGTDGI